MDRIKERILSRVQKPGRYTGGEMNAVVKDKADVEVRFAFCFPDLYEVGMSHLGMKILYSLLNEQEGVWCERVFAPWGDMEEEMRQNGVPLFALESGDPVGEFDMVGFTLQYELSYTNMLNMLDLAGIPLYSAQRDSLSPLVVAGGPCVCNPEPVADFVDLFFLGEGEEVDLEIVELYRRYKKEGRSKAEFLRAAAQVEGVYVPSLYEVSYREDGTVAAVTPKEGAPARVRKRIVKDMNRAYFPETFVVPYLDIVHDRAVSEVQRGCYRACRFCQAGFIYRPVRVKEKDVIDQQCRDLCAGTGYDEISLSSLSTSDYPDIEGLLDTLLRWTKPERVNVSLPSLRVDGFSNELTEKIKTVRRSGLTFAPEAGTQRMRDVINKNVTEEELLQTVRTAFCRWVEQHQAVFYDRPAHGNPGRRSGDCRFGAGGGGSLLPLPGQAQGTRGQRDPERFELRTQAVHAVPVGAAGFHRDPAPKTGSSGAFGEKPQDHLQLARRRYQLFGRGIRPGGSPPGPRAGGSPPPGL